jgi:hypothetical protein
MVFPVICCCHARVCVSVFLYKYVQRTKNSRQAQAGNFRDPSLRYLSEYCVLAIEPFARSKSKEKLAGIVVFSAIGHGQKASKAKSKSRVDFILERRSVNGFT